MLPDESSSSSVIFSSPARPSEPLRMDKSDVKLNPSSSSLCWCLVCPYDHGGVEWAFSPLFLVMVSVCCEAFNVFDRRDVRHLDLRKSFNVNRMRLNSCFLAETPK